MLLVGEATGGCPTQHCTEVKEFQLPYSGLRIQVARRQTNYLPESPLITRDKTQPWKRP